MFPLLLSVPFYFYFENWNLLKHNKRLFDMCNVGDEYEYGF